MNRVQRDDVDERQLADECGAPVGLFRTATARSPGLEDGHGSREDDPSEEATEPGGRIISILGPQHR